MQKPENQNAKTRKYKLNKNNIKRNGTIIK